MDSEPARQGGLRQRKKAATRAALGDAAFHLAQLHGVDAVTAEAIASQVGVSARTFHNYFANKEEAILHHLLEALDGVVDHFAELPVELPVWDALEAATVTIVADPDGDLATLVALIRMVESHPSLMAGHLDAVERAMTRFGRAVAARTGTDYDRDLYPRLVHIAALAACRAAVELWSGGNVPGKTPEQLVGEAFTLLRTGIPEPSAH